MHKIKAIDFGSDFRWGVAQAAFQTEGHLQTDGRSPSIWDLFQHRRGAIKTGEKANHAVR